MRNDLIPFWKILIVEDEALLAEETRERLSRLGHTIVGIADTGDAAIAMAGRHRPDLILMDIRLKGAMSGIEAASRIYEQLRIPVVFTTAHSDHDTLQRAQTPAQFGYVIKPFREQDLMMAIRLAMHTFHAQASLQKTHVTHAAILGSIAESVVVLDPRGCVSFMNLSAEELLDLPLVDALDQPADRVITLRTEAEGPVMPLASIMQPDPDLHPHAGRPHVLVTRRGRLANVELTATPIKDAGGKQLGTAIVLKDVTDQKLQEEVIWHQAHFDEITELPNRIHFYKLLYPAIKRAKEYGYRLAFLLLDLDHFKEINDTLSHLTGNQLLGAVAGRLRNCLRESDILARLGGDEFAIAMPDIRDLAEVEQTAQRLLDALSLPFQIGDYPLHITASIGISLYPQHARLREDLLKYADQAMYTAKAGGRGRYVFFTQAMREQSEEKQALIGDLRLALPRKELSVHYQPIVELATGRVTKAEALLRWTHPKLGPIGPLKFIPLAEETGLIHEIGEWVLDQASGMVEQLWKRLGYPIQISINTSAVQLASPHFGAIDWVRKLNGLQIPEQSIAIEITENTLVKNSQSIPSHLIDFRNHGIEVAIDDFGTGDSSLSYLKKFDIDYLKIDAAFTRDLDDNTSDRALTRAIIAMAHELGGKTIAEGVETDLQRRLLMQMGCDYAQGYFFSRPLPADEFAAYVKACGPDARPPAVQATPAPISRPSFS